MQFKILKNTEIDFSQWNRCVSGSLSPLLYGHTDFLNIVCPGWQGLVVGNYEAVFPLTVNKKFAVNYLYQPAFMKQGGLFYRSENVVEEVIAYIKTKYRFIEINFNYTNAMELLRQRNNFILPLNRPYAEIKKEFSQNHKRNVSRSASLGLKIKPVEIEKIISLFKNNQAKGKKYYSQKDYLRLAQLSRLSCAKCLGVYAQDKLIGGALTTEFSSRITFLFSGYDYSYKKNNGMFFLIDHLIESNANTNKTFDFDGSDDVNLARFYKGFGSTNQPYFVFKYNDLPLLLKVVKK